MKKKSQALETVVHGVFLLLGLITVGCVLLISVYLIVSGIPAIRQIGLIPFLFGKTWASTAAEPSYGILPFILTSVYGTAGAIVLGVPIGFLTAVYLAKVAPPRIRSVMSAAVSLLAGIPSVVYGLVGMLVLVPGIRRVFHLADGASLLAAIVVLAIMILPSIIKVSVTALEAVPPEYEDASLALGATPVETYFKVSVPAARSGGNAGDADNVGQNAGVDEHEPAGNAKQALRPVELCLHEALHAGRHAVHPDKGGHGNLHGPMDRRAKQQHFGAEGKDIGHDKGGNGDARCRDAGFHGV